MIRTVLGYCAMLLGLVIGVDQLIAPAPDPWPLIAVMIVLVLGGLIVVNGLSGQG